LRKHTALIGEKTDFSTAQASEKIPEKEEEEETRESFGLEILT